MLPAIKNTRHTRKSLQVPRLSRETRIQALFRPWRRMNFSESSAVPHPRHLHAALRTAGRGSAAGEAKPDFFIGFCQTAN